LDYPLNIYFVSDGSTDKTNEIIRNYKKINLMELEKRGGKANALNYIIPKLKEDIVVLSDANTHIDKFAISHLTENFVENVGVVSGRYQISDKTTNEGIYWKYEIFLRKLENRLGFNLGASGQLYAIRRELFKPLRTDTILDDMLIPLGIFLKGYNTVFENKARCHELREITFTKEFTRRVRVGAGAYQTMIYLRKFFNPFKGFISLGFYSHKVFRWTLPFFLILLFFSNLLLIDQFFYLALFVLHLGFYLFALLGYFIRIKLFTLPYYFVLMHVGFLIGFFKFAFGLQKTTWEMIR